MRFTRVFRALLRVSFAEASAYRVESIIWLVSTTMPLVMVALFSAVAAEAPIGRFGESGVIAYFSVTFMVRITTGSWAAWEMNMDIRNGSLALRLLRPVSPLLAYAAANLAALPLRGIVALPIAVGLLVWSGGHAVTHDPYLLAIGAVALLGTWLLNVFTNLAIGCLAFFAESSIKFIDLYTASFFLLSGYLIPVDLFPPALRNVVRHLPFHFQMGFAVEVFTGASSAVDAMWGLAEQWMYVVVLWVLTVGLWRRGVRQFAAYGG